MKLKLIPLLLLAMLFAACKPYSEQIIRGTLYADSTKTTPLAGDTLTFRESNYMEPDADSKYLGQAVTDARGRWGFQYIRGFDNPYMQEPAGAKFSFEEYFLLITRGDDTLYWGGAGSFSSRNNDTIDLWPGKWQHPDWWYQQPDTTAIDTTIVDTTATKWKGGLL